MKTKLLGVRVKLLSSVNSKEPEGEIAAVYRIGRPYEQCLWVAVVLDDGCICDVKATSVRVVKAPVVPPEEARIVAVPETAEQIKPAVDQIRRPATLCHEFDSANVCYYCGRTAESLSVPGGGDPGRSHCVARSTRR